MSDNIEINTNPVNENNQQGSFDRATGEEFSTALNEVEKNLNDRRLMFTILNIILPGILLGLGDMLSGSGYPPHISWLIEHSILFAAIFILLISLLISFILMRCHFGLTVNGTKINKIGSGELKLPKLKLRGITTNFIFVNAIISGVSATLIGMIFNLSWLAVVIGILFLIGIPLLLFVNHLRANKLCNKIHTNWEKANIPLEFSLKHKKISLQATNEDISVITALSAALFIGFFSAVSNISGIPETLKLDISVDFIKNYAVSWLSGFVLILILFSSQMIARLRLAVARFSKEIAELHGDEDNPYTFKFYEKTFILYLITVLLAACALVIFIWSVASGTLAIICAACLFLISIIYYIINLKHPL